MSMLHKVVLLVLAVLLISVNVTLAETKGSPYFSVMPKYVILESESVIWDLDQYTFRTGDGDIQVEGKKYYSVYNPKEDVAPAGALQIIRSHTNAALSMGGTVLLDVDEYHDRTATMKIVRGNKEVWAEVKVHHAGEWYTVIIIERGTK